MNIKNKVNSPPDIGTASELLSELNEVLQETDSGDEFRDIYYKHHPPVEDYIESVCLSDGEFNWETAFELTEPYQPLTQGCFIVPVAANLISRGIVRTRINQGVEKIPPDALNFIRSISWAIDGDFAGEYRGVYGWGVGHPTVSVTDYLKTRPMEHDDIFMMGVVDHMFIADQHQAANIVEHWLTGKYNNRFDPEEIVGPIYSLGEVVTANNGDEVVHGPKISQWEHFEEIKRDFTLKDEIGNQIDPHSPLDYSITDPYKSPTNR